MFGDPVDVVDRLAEGRDAVVLPHVALTGVVGRDGKIGVSFKCVEQPAEIARSRVNVRRRIE